MSEFAQTIRENEALFSDLLEAECHRLRRRLMTRIPRSQRSVLHVDDVPQQSCIDAFRTIGQVQLVDRTAFSAWFETIARRNLIDAIRSLTSLKRGGERERLAILDVSQSLTSLLGQLFSHSVTASRQAMTGESLERLREAISRLPEHYRAVVEQYDLQQQNIEEIASSLGKSVGATFMMRSRAHRMLAKMLDSAAPL